jgi:hypothetical protein
VGFVGAEVQVFIVLFLVFSSQVLILALVFVMYYKKNNLYVFTSPNRLIMGDTHLPLISNYIAALAP